MSTYGKSYTHPFLSIVPDRTGPEFKSQELPGLNPTHPLTETKSNLLPNEWHNKPAPYTRINKQGSEPTIARAKRPSVDLQRSEPYIYSQDSYDKVNSKARSIKLMLA